MGEARRRGSRDQRAQQAVERTRLQLLEEQRQAAERQKRIKFNRIRHEIETRHLRNWTPPKRQRPRRSPLHNVALMVALGAVLY